MNKNQYNRARCKESLYKFIIYFWDVIATNVFVDNWHIKAICDEIQPEVLKALRGEKKDGDIIINICPGTTKSTIISQMLPAWCWAVHPKAVIISSTGTSQLTTKNSMKSRDIIQSAKYKALFPEVQIRKDASAKTFYQNTENGTRYAFTTKGNPIGNHAHLILVDDPESQKDARNATMMEYSEESMKALSTRMVDKESTLRILLMQRLSESDSTSLALKKFTNPKHICLPAELSDLVKPKKFREKYIDGLLDPVRLSKAILAEEKKKLNSEENETSEYDYSAQFGQDPQNPEGYLYSELKTFNHNFEHFPEEGSYVYSFTDVADRGKDFLCTIFVRLQGDNAYVFDAIYTQEGSAVTLPLLDEYFTRYNTWLNVIETNNQGSVFITYLNEKGHATQGILNTANKVTRMMSNAMYVQKLIFKAEGAEQYNKYLMALKRFPANCIAKNDDAPDVTSLCTNFFISNNITI